MEVIFSSMGKSKRPAGPGSMPDLNGLVIFATVVESNSFSEAARRLNMPLSTVSRRVADLENELGVLLLERSTRRLRLTDVGSEVFKQAQISVELNDAVRDIVDDHLSLVTGMLRISSPPSISDSVLAPIIGAFQDQHPRVRVQVFVTDRFVDLMAEGIDAAFIVGPLQGPNLVPRVLLTYRHMVLATPGYLREHGEPKTPEDLLAHRLLAFSFWHPENTWNFVKRDRREKRSISFRPYLSMNDYAGMIPRIIAGVGIGEVPPVVHPAIQLIREGKLVEVLPDWKWEAFDLKLVYVGSRYMSRAVRAFIDVAARNAPMLFPDLPT
jgi:DNA-binding transcriptional LysR family regulator